MSNQPFDDEFKQLTHDSVILTPNRRLSAVLHEHYVYYQQQQNLQCWQKPNILSINAWLESLWQQYLINTTDKAPLLLNATQARSLWESIITQDTSHNLLQVAETAEALKSAWELIHQYEIDINHPSFQSTEDYALCQQWLRQYQTLCLEKYYIDNAVLPDFLAEKIASAQITLPQKIFLYGFTEVMPQYEKLLSSCANTMDVARMRSLHPGSDASFIHRSPDAKNASGLHAVVTTEITQLTLPDLDSEILTMARYAKATHEAHPEATIGCVVLDLNQRRERVLQLFTQVFFPDKPYDIDPIDYPFNISAGKSLASYPIIATALTICGLTDADMTREQFSLILLSPYIGEAESKKAERAKLDAELRRNNIHIVERSQTLIAGAVFSYRGASRSMDGKECEYRDVRPQDRNRQLQKLGSDPFQSFTEWAQHFNNMLSAMGWPGEKSLSSEEYQVAQAWLSVLADFASLDNIAAPVTKATAWQHLRQIANAHIFQPQSPKTTIQVLGLLEAAAVPFDYLWVAGLNDMTWPPQPNPQPFIPKVLQRELNMPHATAERELSFCTTILEQFQQATKYNIIFSHAQSDGKIEFKASTLLQHISTAALTDIPQADFTEPANKVFTIKQLETFTDANAPALSAQQKIAGGADVIKQQAACPFRAFATHRLQARELETSTQGLNPKDRGIILHEVMQRIWSEIKSQENLLSMDDATLQTTIINNIDYAITENAPSHHHDTHYIKLEKQRLSRIITQWLELEKTRPPFIVSTREEAAKIELQGRELSLRIDRIDSLADGGKLIIDYKSGINNSTNKWFGERPDEPQLPLYALIDSLNTAGISFAQLAAGNLCFKGISSQALNINGIKNEEETWSEKMSQWRNTLEKLAANFIAGDASVNPKRPSETCKNCGLTPLCRIHAMTDPSCDDEAKEEMYD